MKCRWNRTMLNLCDIVVAILKMSGINIYPHIKFWWYRTMLNICGIVAAILKMATGRNFSISAINSGHHYLPTYQILMISNNVEFLQYCGYMTNSESDSDSEIQSFCHITSFWKWGPVEIFQFWESIRDIIIYPHIKFWWYQAMLNFYRPILIPCFGSHFENGRHLENFENAELLLQWWPITMSNFMSLSLFI